MNTKQYSGFVRVYLMNAQYLLQFWFYWQHNFTQFILLMNRQQMLSKHKEILLDYMDKIRKNRPKQYPTFKDFLNKMIVLVKYEIFPKLGKHMVVFRLTFNIKQTKLTSLALSILFFQMVLLMEEQKTTHHKNSILMNFKNFLVILIIIKAKKKTIIDALINSVTSCFLDKDEIFIQGLQLLVAFILNPYCYVTSQNLTRIIKTIIFTYTRTGSRTQTVDRNAKNMLYQIINYTFKAVEGEVITISRNKLKISIKKDSLQILTYLIVLQLVDMVSLNTTQLDFSSQKYSL